MLILQRAVGESFKIVDQDSGKEIVILLSSLRSRYAKIGVSADQNFLIVRTELDKKEESK